MLMKKIIPAILYLCIVPSALSGETSDLVTGTITVKDSFVDSRIMKFPATVETYDKKQIEESVNAATPAQTLKYLPSIQVRERSIGDRNGIISSRTIGSISSAQSMLYADGVLLSNLLGNSFSYPPRWGMVNPEEIQRISMMYGPFSSLYAGNSMGGVINIETRMPERLEAHAGVQSFIQNFKLYGTDQTKIGNREFFSIGNKVNDFSFWASMNRLENTAQPLDFSVANLSSTAPGTAPRVTGVYQDKGISNQARVIFGATAIDTSIQTNAKFKGQYEFLNQSKLTYTIGLWDLDSRQNVQSYIKDDDGNSIYGGYVNFNNNRYTPRMNPAQAEAFHVMQSLDFKSNDKGFFNWQMTLSDYDYSRDLSNRSNLEETSNANPSLTNPYITKTGQITDLSGTGWTVFDSRVTLRPKDHTIDLGYHLDYYHLRQTVNVSNDWMGSQKGAFTSLSSGNTKTHAVYVQDKWQISPEWALTLGGRQEHYEAYDGVNQNTTLARYEDRSRNTFSPKVSLSFEPEPAWGFRAAFGKAYRFPTVTELFQQLTVSNTIVTNNPNLKPEEIYSSEITAERRFANGLARASLFREDRYDALISQTNVSPVPPLTNSTSYVQNVDHVRIHGIELATELKNVMIPKLDVVANATLIDSEILKNDAAPSYINKKVPRIPRQLYKAVASYRVSEDFTMSLAARYSGRQFIQLDNSDINPETYQGASRFLFVDAKANYKFKDRWTASLGVDNIFNDQAYVSHPLSQRTGYAQIKFDY
ncbi:TonB-dependent receptor [Candidatus Methylopumilus universalis]|uniref:TonB-dependent receptor n=2 Tax=Candidatus Methylopumilus universalis TaxID=2588536 RepID=A0ABX5VS10_9PROT|nr:TonB-dependent receptor [Candidatus Methylopumilus universalis]QDC60898.1 TonB-dependent receptor [Candidatus Methylopumilus universalis]